VLSRVAALLLSLTLAACSSGPARVGSGTTQEQESARPSVSGATRPGAYYKDDGPGANPPNLDGIADAQPRPERLHRFANNPYEVFGKSYVPLRSAGEFRQRGTASWYGRRYHGQKTSSGEIYDMYAMTAAHPTLPIPSYVRVTNLASGTSVVVRVNDRGPFHSDRVIDLSYVAAYKLGYVQAGSAQVEIETVTAGSAGAVRPASPPAAQALAAAPAPVPAQPPTTLPVASNAGGVYLQLGAFSMRDNAELFRAKVYKELAWLNDPMQVESQGGLYRLWLGPYPTQDDARRMAERIQTELNLKPVVRVR
jgi:rare lipoprotein A